MKMFSRPAFSAFGACAVTAILVGCGGSQAYLGVPAPQQNAARAGSTLRSDAAQSLLYVSNVIGNTVNVYGYTKGNFVRTLSGFQGPEGECTDSKGNVWIANDAANAIVEYANGGSKPIATLKDPGNYPYGCSVDPKTGNLAVTNIETTNGVPIGSLTVFPGAKGAPVIYQGADVYQYFFCAYDNGGNLFVDGATISNTFAFAELPHGTSTLKKITLNQAIGSAGNVQWDGKHVAVGDASASAIYQISVSGSTGTVVGTTMLSGGGNAAISFIDGKQVIASISGSQFGFWKYPAGGSPTSTLKLKGVSGPFGVVVSQ
jgi:hypothetical protein